MLVSELIKLSKGDIVYLRKGDAAGEALVVVNIDLQHGLFARRLNSDATGHIRLFLVQSFKPQGVTDV